jgi:hypothetical protein
MLTYEEIYNHNQNAVKSHKIELLVRRALSIQARAKIQPCAYRPNLLNKPGLTGGDAYSMSPQLDLYYPDYDTTGATWQDCEK